MRIGASRLLGLDAKPGVQCASEENRCTRSSESTRQDSQYRPTQNSKRRNEKKRAFALVAAALPARDPAEASRTNVRSLQW